MESKPGAGWGAAAGLALATVSLAVVRPGLLIFLPFSLFLLALPPRRPLLLIAGLFVAFVSLVGAEPGSGPLWYVERGWVLVLAAWFILMVLVLPTTGYLPRALAALGATAGTMGILLLVSPEGWQLLDWTLNRRFQDAAADATMIWSRTTTSGAWIDWFAAAVVRVAEVQALLHPAMLALESLAALAVAWWGYRRIAARERYPLGRLRDFRFGDHLIWLLIAGIVLILLPLGDAAFRAGSNLVAFMGALYALRGGAILLVVFGLQGFGGAVIAALLLLLLYPVVLTTSILVGLSDTWFDLRARRAAARPDS